MNEKQRLRKQMLAYRERLSREQIKIASARICCQLVRLPEYRQAEKILFYMAIKNEVDVAWAMETAWKEGKRVILPRVNKQKMECLEVGRQDELQKGTFGILEPKSGKAMNPERIDLVIVPGIAFDLQGFRLGYGGGYYDRLFAEYPHLKRVGVLEHGQLVPTVYPESHDQPLHRLVTSQKIHQIKRER